MDVVGGSLPGQAGKKGINVRKTPLKMEGSEQ
jgi:hypothetical protein